MQQEYLSSLIKLVHRVSDSILEIYHQIDPLEIQLKSDDTPVTLADMLAHQLLIETLQQLTPDIPIISEESQLISYQERKHWKKFWLVDPLDGTKEFIAKTDDFSINIALIENHQPIFGLIHVPVTGVTYYAAKTVGAVGAEKRWPDGRTEQINTRSLPKEKPLIIASRRYANNQQLQYFLQQIGQYERLSRGSAIKFCLIAEGSADIYPRMGETSEWDSAAGQCFVEAAGGVVVDTQRQPLRYNMRQTFLNPHFIAIGDAAAFWQAYPGIFK
jgi:3'(2'), 5'-bisphosphate nucleotidase